MLTGRAFLASVTVALTLAHGLFFSACTSTSPATPTPGLPAGVISAGQWSGTTSQQQPISFTVSPDQQLTAFSVGYVFTGCSGVETVPGLNYPVRSPVTQFGSTLPDGRSLSVTAVFLPDSSASGGVVFYGPPSCGSTGTAVNFNATRR